MTVKELFDAIPISGDPSIWVSSYEGCDALVTANPEILEFLNDQDLDDFDDIADVMYSVLNDFGYTSVHLDCLSTDEGFIHKLKLDRDTFYSCLKIVDIVSHKDELVLQCDYVGSRMLKWSEDGKIIFTRG